MSNRAGGLTVLYDMRAAHECGQVGTTFYLKKMSNKTILHTVTAIGGIADPLHVFLVTLI